MAVPSRLNRPAQHRSELLVHAEARRRGEEKGLVRAENAKGTEGSGLPQAYQSYDSSDLGAAWKLEDGCAASWAILCSLPALRETYSSSASPRLRVKLAHRSACIAARPSPC